jgi:hypothetical protein
MNRHPLTVLSLVLWVGCLPVPDTSNPLAVDGDGDGFSMLDGDCDDADPLRLNGRWYVDEDADGHFGGEPILSCDRVEGRSETNDDCDDSDPATFVGVAAEDRSACMRDLDGDGFGDAAPSNAGVAAGTDCDDARADVRPGAAVNEPALCTVDEDGDGWGAETNGGSDCDDQDVGAFPGAAFAEPNLCTVDADGDGWGGVAFGGKDCDDTDDAVNPEVNELAGNGLDDDCDPATVEVGTLWSIDISSSSAGVSGGVTVDVFGRTCRGASVGEPLYITPPTTWRGVGEYERIEIEGLIRQAVTNFGYSDGCGRVEGAEETAHVEFALDDLNASLEFYRYGSRSTYCGSTNEVTNMASLMNRTTSDVGNVILGTTDMINRFYTYTLENSYAVNQTAFVVGDDIAGPLGYTAARTRSDSLTITVLDGEFFCVTSVASLAHVL